MTQQDISVRQEVNALLNPVVFQPPSEPFDATLGLGRIGNFGRDTGQLATLAAHNAADQCGQGIEVSSHLAAGFARITLCQGLTYGTITAKVVTHPIDLLMRFRWHLDSVYDEPTSLKCPF